MMILEGNANSGKTITALTLAAFYSHSMKVVYITDELTGIKVVEKLKNIAIQLVDDNLDILSLDCSKVVSEQAIINVSSGYSKVIIDMVNKENQQKIIDGITENDDTEVIITKQSVRSCV